MHSKTIECIQSAKTELSYHVIPLNATKLLQALETCIYSITNQRYQQLSMMLKSGRLQNGVKDIDKLKMFMNYKQ